jgi:hypothetical protein
MLGAGFFREGNFVKGRALANCIAITISSATSLRVQMNDETGANILKQITAVIYSHSHGKTVFLCYKAKLPW